MVWDMAKSAMSVVPVLAKVRNRSMESPAARLPTGCSQIGESVGFSMTSVSVLTGCPGRVRCLS